MGDGEVKQAIGLLRREVLHQRIEGEAGEFQDRDQPAIIDALGALGKGQGYIDEAAYNIGLSGALLLGKSLDPLKLRRADTKPTLNETRHTGS